ncbi:hypothetical protein SASPL_115792 [Salvia splendens]|uniref:FAD dependent oxidoreductase domain-containing protein n=1 Tax=Salvia splendens TaxID=180675 RepID=A0A8X8Y791_SALSN|nr:hypothetical protein SASPL_115792 [Salvia splendens]
MASFPPSSLFRNQARQPIPDPIKLSSSQIMDPQNPPKRVIVCGGGIIGVCAAYFLAKKGAAVTVVEQSSIACAASGKAGGFLALDWCDGGPVSSLARASFNLHRSLAEELNGAESYGYRHLTTLSLSIAEATPSGSKRPAPILPPWVDGAAKSPKIIGTTETTAQVHPKLFTKTLLAKAVEVVIGRVESVEAAEAVALVDGRRRRWFWGLGRGVPDEVEQITAVAGKLDLLSLSSTPILALRSSALHFSPAISSSPESFFRWNIVSFPRFWNLLVLCIADYRLGKHISSFRFVSWYFRLRI